MEVARKQGALSHIRLRLVILYGLNLTDYLFTLFLLRTGLFVEANGVMKQALDRGWWGAFLKVFLVALLFAWIAWRMEGANPKQLKKAGIVINAGLFAYILINLSHFIWTGLYFYSRIPL